MKFEVKRDGKTIMVTEHGACIPAHDEISVMRKAGLKIYVDGKIASDATIQTARNAQMKGFAEKKGAV